MSSDTITSETLIYEKIDYEEGAVVTLQFNKPHTLNALNIEFSREIDAAMDKVEQDDDVKALVLKGSGNAFSAGYDLGRVYFVYGGGTGKPEDETNHLNFSNQSFFLLILCFTCSTLISSTFPSSLLKSLILQIFRITS